MSRRRFLVADPADVLFVQGHHAEGGWAAWQAGEDGKVVTTADWLEGLRLGQLARGREMRPMALVLLGCGVLVTAEALAAARAAMTAGAVDVILGTSAEVSFRDEFAAIQGTGHPRRSALVGARAAVAAWAVAQARAGVVEAALRRWVACATVLAGHGSAKSLNCGVALGMVGKDEQRQIAMIDPRESAMYSADGACFAVWAGAWPKSSWTQHVRRCCTGAIGLDIKRLSNKTSTCSTSRRKAQARGAQRGGTSSENARLRRHFASGASP